MKVKDILKVKGNALFTAQPSATLREALAIMAEQDIGSLLMVENGRYQGILTFRELLAAIHAHGGDWEKKSIGEVAKTNAAHCGPEDDLSVMREAMLQTHARYLPILAEGDLLGVLSFYDVAKAILEEKNFENKMLKSYIADWPAEEDASERVIQAPKTVSEAAIARAKNWA